MFNLTVPRQTWDGFFIFDSVKIKDYLIVGLGIAGLSTAEELKKRGRSFVVYDDDSTRSTSIAGGIINPLMLKNYKLSFQAANHFHQSKSFFRTLEERLKANFFYEKEIWRVFNSSEERDAWTLASKKQDLKPFMGDLKDEEVDGLRVPHGYGTVKGIGFVDTKALLSDYHDDLKESDRLIEESFETENLNFKKGYWVYKGQRFKRMIFCEGVAARKNPFWQNLPLRPNKGEYLIFNSMDLELSSIVKGKHFLIPLGQSRFKFGATYSRDPSSYKSSKEKQDELIGKLEELLSVSFEPVRFDVGMRPTVKDHRPLLGKHAEKQNCFIFNGTGSRGLLMAPSLARELLDHIEEGRALDPEIGINRFS